MKGTRFLFRRLVFHISLLGFVALLAGCQGTGDYGFTHKVWSTDSLRRFNEPATDPKVEVFQHEQRSDVLVQYDEVREKDGAIRRRAFFVNQNLDRLKAGRKPRFVSLKTAAGLKPVPVVPAGTAPRSEPAGIYATVSEGSRQVSLRVNGEELQAVSLPAYPVSSGALRKTLLTPLAVTGDVVVVSCYVGVIAGVLWLRAGGPGVNCH